MDDPVDLLVIDTIERKYIPYTKVRLRLKNIDVRLTAKIGK